MPSRRKPRNNVEQQQLALLKQIAAGTNAGVQPAPIDPAAAYFTNAKAFDTQVFNCFDSYEVPNAITTSTTLPTAYSLSVAAGSLANFSDMSAAFDQYRIRAIEVRLIPRINLVANNGSNLGLVSTVIDYDDANSLATTTDALAYSNCHTTTGNVAHVRHFVPRIATAAYSGSFTSYKNEKADWIDAGSPGVQHYGFKSIVSATDAPYHYDIVVRVWIQYRASR